MPRESVIQRGCIKYLREQGAAVYNIAGGPYQSKATPDLLLCYRGHFIGLEVKQPGEKCTKLQIRELEQIDQAGGIAAVVHSKEECAQLIKGLPELSRKCRSRATRSKSSAITPVKGLPHHRNGEKVSTVKSGTEKRRVKENQGSLF